MINCTRPLPKTLYCIGAFLCAIALTTSIIHVFGASRFMNAARDFFPPTSEFMAADKSEYSIAIASDTGSNNHILEKVIVDITRQSPRPEFMMHLGDFMTRRTYMGLLWMLYEIRPKLGDMPMWATAGNHDVMHYRNNNLADTVPYRSVLGPAHYWFGYGRTLFIVMDTSTDTIDDAQFKWLADTLRTVRPAFRHCIIFTHKPPIDIRPDIKQNHAMSPDDADKFARIVKKHKINAMLSGHVHYFSAGRFAGIPVYTVPSAGQKIRGDVKKYGYVVLTMNSAGLKSVEPKYIDFNGDMREDVEFWFSKYVFSYEFTHYVYAMTILGLMCIALGYGIRLISRRRK